MRKGLLVVGAGASKIKSDCSWGPFQQALDTIEHFRGMDFEYFAPAYWTALNTRAHCIRWFDRQHIGSDVLDFASSPVKLRNAIELAYADCKDKVEYRVSDFECFVQQNCSDVSWKWVVSTNWDAGEHLIPNIHGCDLYRLHGSCDKASTCLLPFETSFSEYDLQKVLQLKLTARNSRGRLIVQGKRRKIGTKLFESFNQKTVDLVGVAGRLIHEDIIPDTIVVWGCALRDYDVELSALLRGIAERSQGKFELYILNKKESDANRINQILGPLSKSTHFYNSESKEITLLSEVT